MVVSDQSLIVSDWSVGGQQLVVLVNEWSVVASVWSGLVSYWPVVVGGGQ